MNTPTTSKINWTSLLLALIGIAVAMEWIPEAAGPHVSEVALILGPALIMVFRTWFTGGEK